MTGRSLMQRPANRLRATRANPPGLASGEGERREIYGAALQQFEELMNAAGAVGPVTRPLPLYYAVHQAGKAFAAARAAGEISRFRGHGLTQDSDNDEDQPSAWQTDILRFRVRRKGSWVFGTVASALGAARLTGTVELGALWSALPEVSPPPDADSWPLALPVYPEAYEAGVRVFTSPAFRGYVYLRGQPGLDDAAAVNALLASYPDGAGAMAETYNGQLLAHPTPWGMGISVQWPQAGVHTKFGQPVPPEVIAAHVTGRVPRYGRNGEHWLIPVVGDQEDQLPPLLLWWVLLFSLSLLARYEPAAWRAALDLDRSPCADPLTQLLDEAMVIVPDLLYEAVTQSATRGTPSNSQPL